MNIEQSLNIQDLNSSLMLVRGIAVIADDVLIAEIERVIAAYERISTTPQGDKAKALLKIAVPAFANAKAIWGRAERASELKSLAVWLTSVQMGWF